MIKVLKTLKLDHEKQENRTVRRVASKESDIRHQHWKKYCVERWFDSFGTSKCRNRSMDGIWQCGGSI